MAPIQEAIKIGGFLKLRRMIRRTPGATIDRSILGNRNALQFAVLETLFVIAIVATINWYFELVFNGKTTVYAGGTAETFATQVFEEFRTVFLPTAISLGAVVSARLVVCFGLPSLIKRQLGTRSLVDAFHFSEGAYGLIPNMAVAASISIAANTYYFGNRMDQAGLFTLDELDNLANNPTLLGLVTVVVLSLIVSFASIFYANFVASPKKLIRDIEFQLQTPVANTWLFYGVNAISRVLGTVFVSAIAIILSILATFLFYLFTDNLRSGLGLTSFEGRAYCGLSTSLCNNKYEKSQVFAFSNDDLQVVEDVWLNEITRKFGRADPTAPSSVRFRGILNQLNSGALGNRQIDTFVVLDSRQVAGDVWVFNGTAVSSAEFIDRTDDSLIAFLAAHASIHDTSGDLAKKLNAFGFFSDCPYRKVSECLPVEEQEISSLIGPGRPNALARSFYPRYREIEVNLRATDWVTRAGYSSTEMLNAIEDSILGEHDHWVRYHKMSPNMWRRIKIAEMRNGEQFGQRTKAPQPERVAESIDVIRVGTISARRQVRIKPDRSFIGSTEGAVLGRLSGSSISSGDKSERQDSSPLAIKTGYAYTVEFNDGSTKDFVKPLDVTISVGTRVSVMFTAEGVKIVPVASRVLD